ncbi:MAG: cytochrome c oxidase assembly protein [Sphingomicrobium sp.]|nr:cytochrome c oxidase assembly protein [Sphingomonadales bacterium]
MTAPTASLDARNRRVGLIGALIVAAMAGLAFASVPLYRIFCEATGFDGTTGRAATAPGPIAAGSVAVRFDANVAPNLAWRFEPEQERVVVRPGAKTQIFYDATNLTARNITGQAVYNVTPTQVGKYFSKIACFCFSEQTLKPGEHVRMPVVFFVDPKLKTDPGTRDIDEITLSYTFYPVESAAAGR